MAGKSDAKVKALLGEIAEIKGAGNDLAWLKDRRAILDTINRYARATDRHDWDMLINDVYHSDALADHIGAVGSPRVIAAHIGPNYDKNYQTHCHVIGNHLCEIDGAVAHTETYVVAWGLAKDGKTLRSTHARYIDKLEKRDGKWKIVLHRIVTDARGVIDAIPAPVVVTGKQDRTDPSYQRPLSLPREKLALLHR